MTPGVPGAILPADAGSSCRSDHTHLVEVSHGRQSRLPLQYPPANLCQSGTLIDILGDVVLNGEYNNAVKIRDVHAPFLLFHGTDDRFIDITKNGEVIFDNGNEPKKFIRVPGAGHTTVRGTMGPDAYIKAVVDFVEAY